MKENNNHSLVLELCELREYIKLRAQDGGRGCFVYILQGMLRLHALNNTPIYFLLIAKFYFYSLPKRP